MGIRFNCPNGHKLNVKEFLAGKRGVCPQCGAKFVIPTPAEGVPGELSQPVGVGLSQSIEIAVAPATMHPVAGAAASPSIIIPTTEVELAPADLDVPPEIRGPQVPVADALPASIVGVQPPIVAAPTQVSPVAAVASQRERSRRNQIVISFLLLALVIVLAVVLVWVLKREFNKEPVEKATAAERGEFVSPFAIVSVDRRASLHPSVGALNL